MTHIIKKDLFQLNSSLNKTDTNDIVYYSFLIWIDIELPRKIRELIQDLKHAGFHEISGGKGSHRKFIHVRYAGAVTLSGKTGADAKPYQEKQVQQAIEEVQS